MRTGPHYNSQCTNNYGTVLFLESAYFDYKKSGKSATIVKWNEQQTAIQTSR